MDLVSIQTVALKAAQRAAVVIVEARSRAQFTVSAKTSPRDLVTTTDREAEQVIIDTIRASYPDHHFLAEEGSPSKQGLNLEGPLWVIDPIDGTTNFIHGLPMVGVSIGFISAGLIQMGVVHCPFLGETFAAIRGGGATLNTRPLPSLARPSISESLVAIGFPNGASRRMGNRRLAAEFEKIYNSTRDARRLGAASIDFCYVAAGRFQGFSESLQPWDIAAGSLIAREAGCTVEYLVPPGAESWPGELRSDHILVAPPHLIPEMRAIFSVAT